MKKIFSDTEKLMQILRFYGLKIVDFGEKIGVNSQAIYNLSCENLKYFNRDMLDGIAKNCPEISLFWLITGEGSMLAGAVEQHNINGDNLNNSQKSTVPDSVVQELATTNANQQQTIAQLVNMLNNKYNQL